MSIRVHVNGQILSGKDARVSVFDRGYLYGDSVFETLGTVAGTLFALPDHLERLERSATLIGITPPARAAMNEAVWATIASANNPESRVRIIVSRGEGWGDLDPLSIGDEARFVVMVAPRGGPTAQMYSDGVAAVIVSVMHNHPLSLNPAVKSGSYLNNVLATGEARRAGAHEAIVCAVNGGIAEGASSNVFVVIADRVVTPALEVGILPGITRKHVLALCRKESIDVTETVHLTRDDLRGADEIFLTSAIRKVLPVTKLDGHDVGGGVPGPMTKRLMHAYDVLAGGRAA